MESHTTGFPPFPLLLEIPLGFPHSPPRSDYGLFIQRGARPTFKRDFLDRKGVVTDVSRSTA
jgi:hypothetical protein